MDDVETYLELRKISGLSNSWLSDIRQWVIDYLNTINWTVNQKKTFTYLSEIQHSYSITGYRKKVYQIRKFLTYLNIGWAKDIKPPKEPNYIAKRITIENLKDTLSYFKYNEYYLQVKALISLGASSGLRAEELYQLTPDDIDLKDRIIHINHDPKNGQTTKTKQSRISFFTNDAKEIIDEFITHFNQDDRLKKLFSQGLVRVSQWKRVAVIPNVKIKQVLASPYHNKFKYKIN